MDISMTEIFGWFPIESERFLEQSIKENDIKTVIEIGSFVGKSTIFFARHCDKVYAVDPFIEWEDSGIDGNARQYGSDFYSQFISNIVDSGVRDKIEVLRMSSEEANKQDITADLIYIDGSHMYENVKKDIEMWLPRANKIICGDDYDEHWPNVKKAVDDTLKSKAKINGRIWYYNKQ